MKFHPLTEQEIRDNKYLPTGTYFFTIKAAEEKLPAGGTHAIELQLTVARGDGRIYPLRDTLSSRNIDKLRALCLACGLIDKYQQGTITPADLVQKTGHARVFLTAPRGEYPEKNVISTYIAKGLAR